MAETAVLRDVGFYFYGVVRVGTDVSALRGLDEAELETVERDELAAVVSRLPLERPPGRSAELVAHARVVDGLAAETAVVPAQFGLVLDHDRAAVNELLEERSDLLRTQLDRLTDVVQLNLRASYVPEQVLGELVGQEPAVAELRRRTRDLPPGAAHPELVRLGEAVARGLNRKRFDDAEALLDVVLPLVVEHVVRPGGEYDVLDLALLVRRNELDAVEQRLEELAEAVHERVRLRLVGPVAPYDFVEGRAWD